jgi:hypothetical protein
LTIFLDLNETLLNHDVSERSAAVEFFHVHRAHFLGCAPGEFADRRQTIVRKHLNQYLAGRLRLVEQLRARLRGVFGLVDVAICDDGAVKVFARP